MDFSDIRAAMERRARYTGKQGMIIVVIEDDSVQRQAAEQILMDCGHAPFSFPCLGGPYEMDTNRIFDFIANCDGVITDMNFDPNGYKDTGVQPGGLLSVFLAQSYGKPVVICSKMDYEKNHGGPLVTWLKSYIDRLSAFPPIVSEFDEITGVKDWKSAARKLAGFLENQPEPI